MARQTLFSILENAKKKNRDFASEFLTDLEYHIKKSEEASPRVIHKTFKPSSIKCQRRAVMQALGIRPMRAINSANSVGITELGSFIHQTIQHKVFNMDKWEYVNVVDFIKDNSDLEVLKESNFEQGEFETKLHSKKWNMNFLVDGILKKDDKYFILEIKSINSGGFYKTKEVPSKYKDQAISYCNLLGLDEVLFLFVDRDLFNMKTFMYRPSRQEKNKWKTIMQNNLQYVEDNVIPAKPKEAGRDFCLYCDYTDYCNKLGADSCEYRETV